MFSYHQFSSCKYKLYLYKFNIIFLYNNIIHLYIIINIKCPQLSVALNNYQKGFFLQQMVTIAKATISQNAENI